MSKKRITFDFYEAIQEPCFGTVLDRYKSGNTKECENCIALQYCWYISLKRKRGEREVEEKRIKKS